MVSCGSWWLGVLLCVFWLSQGSLKTCEAAVSLRTALGGIAGGGAVVPPTRAEVIAMRKAAWNALDLGMSEGARCVEAFTSKKGAVVNLVPLSFSLAVVVAVPLEEVMAEKSLSKEAVQKLTALAGLVGMQLCSLKEELVCVSQTCTACKDVDTKSKDVESVCQAAVEIKKVPWGGPEGGEKEEEPQNEAPKDDKEESKEEKKETSGANGRRGCSAALIFTCVSILRSLFFM